MKKNLFILLIISSLSVKAQQAIEIDPRAVTVPRYPDATAIDAIASPKTGMMVYNLETKTNWTYNGTAWVNSGLWTASGDNIIYDSGKVGVGIGPANIFSKLEVFDYNESNLLGIASYSPYANFTIASVLNNNLYHSKIGNYEDRLYIIGGQNISKIGIFVGGSERLNILSNGNVGINQTNPTEKLEVNGKIKMTDGNQAIGKILTSDASGVGTWQTLSLPAPSQWTTAGSNIHYSSGNVGIGTSTPNAQLELAPTLANRKIVLHDLANNDNQFNGFGINPGIIRYQVGATAADHVFFAGVNSTTSYELLRIKGNGNVGIGLTTPNSKLEVNGTIATKLMKLNTFTNVTLDETATVWYFSTNPSVAFPNANTCENRRYVLVNTYSAPINLSIFYLDFNGTQNFTLNSNSSIEIISDGTNWLQIK